MPGLPLKTLVFVPSVDQTGEIGAGGAERMARNLCLAFDRSKIIPSLLTLKDPGAVGDELRSAGVQTYLLKKKGKIDWDFWKAFRRLIENGGFDAVLSMLQGANFHNLVVTPRTRKAACIIRIARVNVPWKIAAIEGPLSKRADLLVVNAAETARKISGKYCIPKSRVAVIPNGCDEERFKHVSPELRPEYRKKLGLPEAGFLLYSASRIHTDKGLDIFAEALASLPPEVRQEIIWVNTGSVQSEELKAKILKIAGNSGVSASLLPPVPSTEEFIAACDAVVIPSRTEAFPNVLIEAGCIGRRVIATITGEVPKVAGEIGGVSLCEANARSLADSAGKLYDSRNTFDTAESKKISANTIGRYGIKAVADIYAKSIETACAKKSESGHNF